MMIHVFSGYGQSDFPYQSPDAAILSLADASPAPALRLNAEASKGLLLYRKSYKSIEELSAPELKLAGLRVHPVTNAPSRTVYYTGFSVLDVRSGREDQVEGLPVNSRMSGFTWSHSQQKVAFTNITAIGVELWVLDLATLKATRLTEAVLNASVSNVFMWDRDDASILATTLVNDRTALADSRNAVPSGPVIAENDGQKAQNRTYQDLLRNAVDEKNFETLITSTLTRIHLDGTMTPFLPAAMYTGFGFSPDGKFLLVYELKRPFSYMVTFDRFPQDIWIVNSDGSRLKKFAEIPLTEELPKGFMAVRKGPRSIQWRADQPSTLVWVEARDDGDPAKEVPFRDAVYMQEAPFTANPTLLAETKFRFAGIQWGNETVAILNERWWNTRLARTLILNPSQPGASPRLFNERNEQDTYADPGSFVMRRNQYNLYTLDLTENALTMLGDGYSPEGKLPFIDRYSLEDLRKNRVYQAPKNEQLEQLVSAVDVAKGLYITRLESKNEYPNFYLRNIAKSNLTPITRHVNPFKVFNDVHKEVIRYKREDGVELSATLYLPLGYDRGKKEKMPMVMWAYPNEFKDKASAGQVTSSPNEFTAPYYGSPLYWLTRGYVVLDDASFPIIGEGDTEPNDTYIPQLVANAKAAIDAVDTLGYIDRSRVAVGGHSYGAFMTANLLTHSNLFAAGVARSGAYNRTLTPFGFQSEERNYWEAPQVYDAMSPFQHADKMKTPLLLIHGEEDNNAGTHTMQSERYFAALKGLGAVARLVILPKESHGYAARESILHMLWEQDQWLDKYVKNRAIQIKP
jgi:dipeptidyl aminopeptidase/acylaminoacyl peptidase